MKKKIWLGIGLILVLGIVGTSVYLSTLDWNQHKDKIAAQFSEVTGKRVVFEGPVSFSIFPSPYLTASNIKVYNMDGAEAEKPLASIKSLIAKLSLMPLLNGNFEVKMMSLVEPDIFFELLPDGSFNWQSPLSEEQKTTLNEINVSLDSVLLEKATVNIIDEKHNIETTLNNLNAEIIASSVFGPYRIEGSYLKGKNPEGFAISLGQFSESFATSVNLVLNQPTSQTYLRFDGSMLFQNDAINGNIIFDSKNLSAFMSDSIIDTELDKEYDYPLAISMELNSNKTKIDLSNIVVKYGKSAGAGNILIPLLENEFRSDVEEEEPERRKIEIAFDMTDLDLKPAVYAVKSFIDKYAQEGAEYNPLLGFDVLADFKAIKSYYNDQTIRDFNLSVDFIDNQLTIKNFTATLPGETTSSIKGDVFSVDDVLTYSFDTSLATIDFLKMSEWLGYKIEPVVASTYKKFISTANISGNLKTIKISPFDVTLDKIALKGDLGIVKGVRDSAYLVVNADSINFDNYVNPLPAEEAKKDFASRMAYRFGKLKMLNDFDLNLNSKLDLGIYEAIPFENTKFDMELANGVMNIKSLNIGSIANAAIQAEGKVKGFGAKPQFDNIKYDLSSPDVVTLLNKFEMGQLPLNTKNLKNVTSKGIFSGFADRIAIKSVSKLGYIDNVYSGEIMRKDGKYFVNGQFELKAPDFVKFVNDMNFAYSPKAYSLGALALKTNVNGSDDKFVAKNLDVFVGANNFKGDISFNKTTEFPNIAAKLSVNSFETERFFYNDLGKGGMSSNFKPDGADRAEFVAKPYFDKTKFNYAFYNRFNFVGEIKALKLSYQNLELNNAIADLSLTGGILRINNLSGGYNNEPFVASAEYGMTQKPYLKGKFELKNQILNEGILNGSKYGIRSGRYDLLANFETMAASEEDMFKNLNADVDFIINNPIVKGWDLAAIQEDLAARDKSEGLATLVQDNLQKGETAFNLFQGKLKINKSNYNFENALFLGNDVKVDMNDSGSTDIWDMDAKFKVQFENLKTIPYFLFTMSGPMITPNIAVDVKSITDIYDTKWAKVAADKKATEDARAEFLKGLMDKQQKAAHDVKNRLDTEVVPEYEKRKSMAKNVSILKQYEVIKSAIDKLDNSLNELFALGLTRDFDEKLPESIEKKREVYALEIDKLKADINANYVSDVKQQINEVYNRVADVYSNSKTKSLNYQSEYAQYPKRIANIQTVYVMDEDEQIKNLRAAIEEKLLAIDAINTKIVKDYVGMQNISDWAKLEEYRTQIQEFEKKSQQDIVLMDEDITNLLNYAKEKAAAEEKIYNDTIKAAEIKRKLEENIGKISGAKGQTKTVVRDLEEIEKSEEALEKEQVKVLDFTERNEPVGVIRNEDTGIEKKENPKIESEDSSSGLVRKISGSVSKASGKIVKQ